MYSNYLLTAHHSGPEVSLRGHRRDGADQNHRDIRAFDRLSLRGICRQRAGDGQEPRCIFSSGLAFLGSYWAAAVEQKGYNDSIQ